MHILCLCCFLLLKNYRTQSPVSHWVPQSEWRQQSFARLLYQPWPFLFSLQLTLLVCNLLMLLLDRSVLGILCWHSSVEDENLAVFRPLSLSWTCILPHPHILLMKEQCNSRLFMSSGLLSITHKEAMWHSRLDFHLFHNHLLILWSFFSFHFPGFLCVYH